MAEIRYTDPDNILESGIDVIAQLLEKQLKILNYFQVEKKHLLLFHYYFHCLKRNLFHYILMEEVSL
ncbi:hypothetical protein [Metamycoplasma orale]|uniref:hypothetical protein n=1 Tax=Metamycoplasma orale TaxID=2121 RepID=UPI001E2BF41A|nr:hypothetical protein [Metamycoplasma orale]